MSESDGIEEAIEGISRVGLTVAARLGEQLARARETALRRAQAAEEQQGRELQARFDAERAAARAQLAPTMDSRWWDTAKERDIERAVETANAWRDYDPTAKQASDNLREQVLRRYGADISDLGSPSWAVDAGLARVQEDRDQAQGERGTAKDERALVGEFLGEANREDNHREVIAAEENGRRDARPEPREAGREPRTATGPQKGFYRPSYEEFAIALDWAAEQESKSYELWGDRYAGAETSSERAALESELVNSWRESPEPGDDLTFGHESALRADAGVAYDSAERRQDLAASLDSVGDREAVQARLSADQDQGTPPSAAVAKSSGKAPKARKTRGAIGPTKILQKGMNR